MPGAAALKQEPHPAELAKLLPDLRTDFPMLQQQVYGKPLVFLDSAASAQKPEAVIEAEAACYRECYANVQRGIYYHSVRITDRVEAARNRIARFLNAQKAKEIIFVRGATEAINLVAQSYGRAFLQPGDEIIITEMEHHANIVPWQILRDEKKLVLKIAPITDDGALDMAAFTALLGPKTRLVAVTHTSNVLGTVVDVREIARLAHAAGAKVLVDGCQAVPHRKVDVQALDADFYVFSAHKLYGPSGIGALYGKEELLERMPPWQGGGEMIREVTFEKTTYADLPHKFEAGTPAIAQIIGLEAAINYLESLGLDRVQAHDHALLGYARERLSVVPGLTIIGTAPEKTSILSFTLKGIHPHDIGTVLDREGIAIRVGHHCAQPLMGRLRLPATARASFGVYTRPEDIDALAEALEKVQELLG